MKVNTAVQVEVEQKGFVNKMVTIEINSIIHAQATREEIESNLNSAFKKAMDKVWNKL